MQKPRLINQAGAQRSDLEYSPQQPAECRRALNNHDPHRAAPSLLTCWLSCWRVRYTMQQKAAVLPVRSRKHHQAMPAAAGKNRLRSYEFIADAKRIIRREGRVSQRIKHPGFTDAVQNAVQRKEVIYPNSFGAMTVRAPPLHAWFVAPPQPNRSKNSCSRSNHRLRVETRRIQPHHASARTIAMLRSRHTVPAYSAFTQRTGRAPARRSP